MKEAPYFRRLPPLRRLLWMHKVAGGGSSILKTVTGALLHITDALAKPLKKLVVNLEPVQSGSGDPSPENVRPITGHTGCDVTRTGKNLFNKNDFVSNEGYINPTDNNYRTGSGRVTAVLPDPIPIGTYTISRATSARLRVGLVTSTTLINLQPVINKVSGENDSDSPVTITVSQSGYYLAIFFKDAADTDEQYLLDHLQVEVGSTATSYENYNGATVSVTFPASAGTVYGGTLDVTTGVLTVNRGYVALKDLTWTHRGGTTFSSSYGSRIQGWINASHHLCDCLPVEYAAKWADAAEGKLSIFKGGSGATETIYLNLSDISTDTALTEWLTANDPHLCCVLANPETYQLTPTEIQMLLGENNIWCDASDSLELTYYADGNVSTLEALNTLLGGRYTNLGTPDDVSDKEALQIILGETT